MAIDRTDLKYKKAKRTVRAILGMAQNFAYATANEDDDEIVLIIDDIIREKFDEFWEVRYPKK